MLRTRPARAAFFAGSRRLQSDVLAFAPPPITDTQCAVLAAALAAEGLAGADHAGVDPAARFLALTADAHAALLREAGFFFPEHAEPIPRGAGGGWAVAVPKIPCGTDLAAELFQRLARLCGETALGGTPVARWLGPLRAEIAKVPQPLLAAAHMVRAAHALGLPVLEWHSVFVQVGYGRNGIALSGSITEHTPSIGVHFAREKGKANALLARAGFPVAEGGLVRNLAEARERAAAMGYPVVVKPADRDGGNAVSSGIADPAELEEGFAKARAASPRVMVEKHVDGTDYRLLLYRDELLVALERTPGGVTGNGSDTVAGLLERVNAEPGRGDGPSALLHRIAFDDEARQMLARQGLAATSVPAAGRFVPLRRAANHALGGSLRRVEQIHPDNLDLARRAMRQLRLDLAGLDLILPDIARSWRETGGAICEVNAQPYIGEPLGRDYYGEILQQLVPRGGRIPLVLAVGAPDAKATSALEQALTGLAVVDGDGARRDGHPLSLPGLSWPQACQAALYDQRTAAALCWLDPARGVPDCSPADRFSAALVLAPLDAIDAPLAALLRRADAIRALAAAGPALARAGLEHTTLRKADVAAALAAALGAAPSPPAARTAPARRETARPASRTRR